MEVVFLRISWCELTLRNIERKLKQAKLILKLYSTVFIRWLQQVKARGFSTPLVTATPWEV